jgi:hypothetical protein
MPAAPGNARKAALWLHRKNPGGHLSVESESIPVHQQWSIAVNFCRNPLFARYGKAWLAFIVVLGMAGSGHAVAADDSLGFWTVFTATDAFQTDEGASRWRYWLDAQARYFDLGSGVNQYLVRPAIGYKPGDNMSVWLGYAHFRSRGRSGNVVDEDRLYQQLSWTTGHWRGGTFSMRARLLQRNVSASDDTGLTLRFLTRYVRPIGTDGSKSLILGIEPFFDLRDTDWTGEAGIAQNRTYLGINWRISPKLSIDTGYMNQYVWVDDGQNLSNHLGVINFRTSFSLDE